MLDPTSVYKVILAIIKAFFDCAVISKPKNTHSPPGPLVPRPVPAAAFEPAVLLSPSLPVPQRTVAASAADKLVPLAPVASHILRKKTNIKFGPSIHKAHSQEKDKN